MPANLTPEYIKADQVYRSATTTEEKILAVEHMLRVIPKHKGTDHMRSDLRKKLSKLKSDGEKKSKSSGGVDIFHIPKGGAGQVTLLGLPNCGKSAIVAALTKAKVTETDFPFATALPVPGMAKYEDVPIQLVDLPPITKDFIAPGQIGTFRACDIIAIVIDLSADCLEQMEVCMEFLKTKNLYDGPGDKASNKKVFCICTKSDVAPEGTLESFIELCEQDLDFIEISPKTGYGLDALTETFFNKLSIIRVYAKPPGKPADMTNPFTLPIGSTVMDLATGIHRQLAEKLKSAKAWGQGIHDGQNVHRTHILHDKDIVELHF